jgi:uncharacterized glyoxalase superfamily protein PhnB
MLKKLWTNMMVSDIHETIGFYQKMFGFEHVMSVPKGSEDILFQYDAGQQLVYAVIRYGDIEMMLQERESLMENIPGAFQPDTLTGGTVTFFFATGDVSAIAAKVKGVCEIVRDLHDTFYGMREIYIRDLNGYILCFAQQIMNSEPASEA